VVPIDDLSAHASRSWGHVQADVIARPIGSKGDPLAAPPDGAEWGQCVSRSARPPR
jgi:hypothetical protein